MVGYNYSKVKIFLIFVVCSFILICCKPKKEVKYKMPVSGFDLSKDGVPKKEQIMINGEVFNLNDENIEIKNSDSLEIYLTGDQFVLGDIYVVNYNGNHKMEVRYMESTSDLEHAFYYYYKIDKFDGEDFQILKVKEDALKKGTDGEKVVKDILRDYEIYKKINIKVK